MACREQLKLSQLTRNRLQFIAIYTQAVTQITEKDIGQIKSGIKSRYGSYHLHKVMGSLQKANKNQQQRKLKKYKLH